MRDRKVKLKKLEDVSIETDEGTIKLTDFSMNKLQSTMTAEIPEELAEKLYNNYEMILVGTDSKGNQVQYELSNDSGDRKVKLKLREIIFA